MFGDLEFSETREWFESSVSIGITFRCFLSHRISDLIYQWLYLEVSIFYALKELICIFLFIYILQRFLTALARKHALSWDDFPVLAKQVVRNQDTIFAYRDPPIAAFFYMYGGIDIAWSPYGSY